MVQHAMSAGVWERAARRTWRQVEHFPRLARMVRGPARAIWRLAAPVPRGAPYTAPRWSFQARDWRHVRGTILVVDHTVPEFDRHAGAVFIYEILRILVDNDFRVVYLPHDRVAREPYTATLQRSGIEVLTGNLDVPSWLEVNGANLDWVLLARPEVAAAHLRSVRKHTHARVLYYTHDLHFLRELRRYETTGDPEALRESERIRATETQIFRAVDCVVTPSTDELPLIRELAPGCDARALPPGVMRQGPSDRDVPPLADRDNVIFVGGFTHPPNVDAARLLVEGIMPSVWERIPRARVLLIGSSPPADIQALSNERVVVTGYVPDLAVYYAQARMSVSPIRFGSGVKGKIIESLAAGVPVVTTAVGNEGIGLVGGVEGLIADEPGQLAAHIINLFEDDRLLTSLGAAGRKVIAERFSEAHATEMLFAALGLGDGVGGRPAAKARRPAPIGSDGESPVGARP